MLANKWDLRKNNFKIKVKFSSLPLEGSYNRASFRLMKNALLALDTGLCVVKEKDINNAGGWLLGWHWPLQNLEMRIPNAIVAL